MFSLPSAFPVIPHVKDICMCKWICTHIEKDCKCLQEKANDICFKRGSILSIYLNFLNFQWSSYGFFLIKEKESDKSLLLGKWTPLRSPRHSPQQLNTPTCMFSIHTWHLSQEAPQVPLPQTPFPVFFVVPAAGRQWDRTLFSPCQELGGSESSLGIPVTDLHAL